MNKVLYKINMGKSYVNFILICFKPCLRACSVTSVVSNSLRPYGLQPARLLCPWNSPGKNIGVGCHAPLQGIFPTQGSNPHLLCLLHCRWILYPLNHLGSHCKPQLSLTGTHMRYVQASFLAFLQILGVKFYCSESSKLEGEPMHRMPHLPFHLRDTEDIHRVCPGWPPLINIHLVFWCSF